MQKQKAFTIVELLIAMSVLAVLAVLMWTFLNPLEQIKKAQDTAMISNARELAKSIERYLIATDQYPWNQRNDSFDAAVRGADRFYYYDPTAANNDMNWIWNLVAAEETKETTAKALIKSSAYYVYKSNGVFGSTTWVCFEPDSVMYMKKAADACNVNLGKTAPDKYRTFDPCQTSDGLIADPESGWRNLLCVSP